MQENLPVLWCREWIETCSLGFIQSKLLYLPVLWCREWIETSLSGSVGLPFFHLPVLWCREWIETYPKTVARSREHFISLYSGAGSGLKLLYIERIICPGDLISLYSGAGSGLKLHFCDAIRYRCVISLYSGAGSGLKHHRGGAFVRGISNLPVLWCREWIETTMEKLFATQRRDLPVLWCREWIETYIQA